MRWRHANQDQKVKADGIVQQDQLVFAIWNNGPAFPEEMLLGAELLFYQTENAIRLIPIMESA